MIKHTANLIHESDSLPDTPAWLAAQVEALTSKGIEKVPALIDLILSMAIRLKASDVHLQPTENEVIVQLRQDGVLNKFGLLPIGFASNIIARCKVMAGLLSYRTDIPQEGGAGGVKYGKGVDLRISTFPTIYGERVAIRIFNAEQRRMGLAELGFGPKLQELVANTLLTPEGLVLLSGPCGSGKTTTLYAALAHINEVTKGGRSIFTVEDPVENKLPGIIQTSINRAVGLTFAKSLSSLLRQDPDVIMVGEIRDTETAKIALESALTGHLVLSTVHAPRAATVPHRLLDMGVEPYALAGTLKVAMSQRLLRLLCPKCKQLMPQGGEPGEHIAVGCQLCGETGYIGRRLIAEFLASSELLHNAIMNKEPRKRFFEIARTSGDDLEMLAWNAVENGETTRMEVKRLLAGDKI